MRTNPVGWLEKPVMRVGGMLFPALVLGVEFATAPFPTTSWHHLWQRWAILGVLFGLITVVVLSVYLKIFGNRLSRPQKLVLLLVAVIGWVAWSGVYITADPAARKLLGSWSLWLGGFILLALFTTALFVMTVGAFEQKERRAFTSPK